MWRWDTDKVFHLAGGPTGLLRMLNKHSIPGPTMDTIYMWKSRGQIAGKWWPTIMVVLLAEGHKLRDFLVKGKF